MPQTVGILTLTVLVLSALGCSLGSVVSETIGNDSRAVDAIMRKGDREVTSLMPVDFEIPPATLNDFDPSKPVQYRELSLREAILIAIENSEVLRDLGATVLKAPAAVTSRHNLALQATDPRFGVEAALSAFDAHFNVLATFQKNDRQFNNRFFGGGANEFRQDRHDYVVQLNKRSATGAQFSLRSITDYDANNATGNLVPSAFQSQIEGELRQPLLRGGGLTFNRIAGPGASPGVYNGVLIARTNHQISEIQFEQGVQDFFSDVVNAYWDLYFAYRDYDAKRQALEQARQTWRGYHAKRKAQQQGAAAELLAREQYFRFESELLDALAGKKSQRTRNGNGSRGGIFSGVNGVQAAERRLRLIIGLPLSDQRMLRTSDSPLLAPVVFDWQAIATDAIHRRTELRQQRMVVKRLELELLAARNFLRPQLDFVGRYRVRGLGHDLSGRASALETLGDTNFQEWEAGLEFSLPIGFRQAHAGVRNAQLKLTREKGVLEEQKRQILHDLSATVAEVQRAYQQTLVNQNRYAAAKDALDALLAKKRASMTVNLDQLLDIQRRLSEAQTRYFLAQSEYIIALKNVHLEKGALLEHIEAKISPP